MPFQSPEYREIFSRLLQQVSDEYNEVSPCAHQRRFIKLGQTRYLLSGVLKLDFLKLDFCVLDEIKLPESQSLVHAPRGDEALYL